MNEKDVIKKLKNVDVTMDPTSRSRIFENIIDHTGEIDVTKTEVGRNTLMNIFKLTNVQYMQKKVFTIAVVSFAIAGLALTGTAMASDSAIPGSLGYGVDQAAEKVASMFKFGDTAKVEHEMDLLDERMAELGEVLGKSDVDPEKVQKLMGDLEDQHQAVRDRLQDGEFSGEDNERVMNRYEEQVSKYAQLMVQLQAQHQNQINQYGVQDDFEEVKYQFQSQEKVNPGDNGNEDPGNSDDNGSGSDNGNAGDSQGEDNGAANGNTNGVMIQDPNRDNYDKDAEGPEIQEQNQIGMPD